MVVAEAPAERKGAVQRMFDGIERVGNKVSHPAVMFVGLCLLVIVLSAILAAANVQVTTEVVSPPAPVAQAGQNYPYYPGGSIVPDGVTPAEPPPASAYVPHTETIAVESLLSTDGIRFIFTSFVDNFNNFSAVGVIIIAMIGVGLAEEAGLIGALIRRIVKVAPRATLTFIIVLAGMISSVASDAGYLVLVPLGAVVFRSVGRNPIAGIAAAFAGVSAGFGVNFLITPVDGIVTEITNESIHLVDPSRTISVVRCCALSAAGGGGPRPALGNVRPAGRAGRRAGGTAAAGRTAAQPGDPGAHLHPAVPAAGRHAGDRDRRLPGG
jgi:aminobenzoyl-glutamate transport protein